MSKSILKRPRAEERSRDRPSKKPRKFKKQLQYHSSSDDEDEDEQPDFKAVNLQDSDDEEGDDNQSAPTSRKSKAGFVAAEDDDDDDDDEEASEEDDNENQDDDAASDITGLSSASSTSNGDTSTITTENGTKSHAKRKRNDPTAFATSISKILSSKLSTTSRSDPLLSRSAAAHSTSAALSASKLEARAKAKLRSDRKLALEKGRIRDVLGLETPEESTEAIMEREGKLRKTAQRGVVKLFNAVREAQRRGEIAKGEARKEGVVGRGAREEKVSEMSKQGFLDLIAGSGKGGVGSGGVKAVA